MKMTTTLMTMKLMSYGHADGEDDDGTGENDTDGDYIDDDDN